MKTKTHRRPSGFTLIELLVVIAIIAILAGAGFAAGNAALQKARRTKALAVCTSVETAVNNFFTEYWTMPVEATQDKKVNLKDESDILQVLLGDDKSNSLQFNPRQIKFLDAPEGKKGKDGLIFDSQGSAQSLVDPWRGPYFMILDCDYNEEVTPVPSAGGSQTPLKGRRVAAWTNGADAAPNGTGGAKPDDVKTWE